MDQQVYDSFTPEVISKLKTYVYRLIDPRNGETFYIGKGKGNRIFSHIKAETKLEGDDYSHGMDDSTAFEVESALIDAYPGLTNIVDGSGGNEFGAMHAKEIIKRYSAEPAIFKHKALLITINRTATEQSIYNATRFAWKISKSKVKDVELVLSIVQGLIVGAFIPLEWLDATTENFPDRAQGEDRPGRIGFIGKEASDDIKRMYVGKRIPDGFRPRGAANPIMYTWSR
jgi:hypothetical protein